MTTVQRLLGASLLVACGACGAPSAVAQDTPTQITPSSIPADYEAEHFKTVCSIAVKDLDAGVSIYVEEGWDVVSCSPYVNPLTDGPAPIIGHCCYLTR